MNLAFFAKRYRPGCFVKLTMVLVGGWLGSSLVVVWMLTSRSSHGEPNSAPPASFGPVESLQLDTVDGEHLQAWFVAGQTDRPVVLILHGNRSHRHAVAHLGELVHAAGCSAMLPTLRAHGDSTGETNDLGYSARHDVIAAIESIERRCPARPIVILGQSLGAAAAMFAAETLDSRVAGYILECPYENLYSASWNRTHAYLPRGLDYLAYGGLRITAPLVLPDVERINLVDAANRMPVRAVVLILAGENDDRAPPHEARRIAERLGSRARVEVMAEARHLGLFHTNREQYTQWVLEFIERCGAKRTGLP